MCSRSLPSSFESVVSGRAHRVHDPDPVLVAADADLDEPTSPVGSEVEHHIVVFVRDADPVAERVANVCVVDAVLAGAGSDRRLGYLPVRQG